MNKAYRQVFVEKLTKQLGALESLHQEFPEQLTTNEERALLAIETRMSRFVEAMVKSVYGTKD
jgi:hypothetical protein